MAIETPSPRAIFEQALELNSQVERQAFVEACCAGRTDLRDEVQSLLKAHAEAGSFLNEPGSWAQSTGEFDPIAERPGTIIGPYKLLEQVGEGGFGVVFMAEQERPVSRRVALKVIKPGMDTREVIARFEAERQALAMMDHHNIAKVLEAGATESGRPYFVMELVRGIPITEFCDQNCLSVQQRLALFMTVCQAVQHAHQKGIIHRDIKPTNVLVTLHDGEPVAKVIDFGVAKAMGQRLTDKTMFTAFAQMVGTPLYMSPEQAEMSGLDVDTRSDIYSLGVLLYELLTGTTPFDKARLHGAAFDEIRRIIRHEEPPKPSTRISTLGRTATTTSAQRKSEPEALRRQLRGDLDWIVMKCLEKDRTRRYETANNLAQDLKRHLENEPVIARPSSTAYRLRKAWQRNKVVCAAGTLVLLALVFGLMLAGLGLRQALTERDAAVAARAGEEQQRKRAQANEKRAIDERRRAELASEETRRRSYVAEISTAFLALSENNLGRAIHLLNRQVPKPGEEDLRGFEWCLLWSECQSDAKATFDSRLIFSPNGQWVACDGEQIVIRDLTTQTIVATIPHSAGALAFSPDSRLLASGHDSQVTIWSTTSWEEVLSLKDAGEPAVFSPDGKWLVTVRESGYHVWKTEMWEETRQLPDARDTAVFSPDGNWFVTAVPGGYQVWSTQTWEPPRFCAGEPKMPWVASFTVAFSPDGRFLVTAGNPDPSYEFQVWDVPSLTVRSNFVPFSGRLTATAFAPDGEHLLTGRDDGAVLAWNIAEGHVVEELKEHTGWISSIRYAPDGQTFVTASCDRTIIIWDAERRTKLAKLRGHVGEVWSADVSRDGNMLASNSSDGTSKLWDITTRHHQRELADCFLVTGFSSDSRVLVADGRKQSKLLHLAGGAITPVPLQNYDELHFREIPNVLSTCRDVHGIDPQAIYGRNDGVLEFWNLASMSSVSSWRVYESEVTTAGFSPDGQYIATSDEHGDITLWHKSTHREVRHFERLGGRLTCLTFSRDGRLLAASENNYGGDSRVGIWDISSGALVGEPDIHGGAVYSVAFSPDGTLLATAEKNNNVQLWEVPSGKLKATLMGHIMFAVNVAFSPDGKTLATAADDHSVKLWNVATEQEMVTLEVPGGCRSLKFSPDGCVLAVGYWAEPETYVRLWEVPSLKEIDAAEADLRIERNQP